MQLHNAAAPTAPAAGMLINVLRHRTGIAIFPNFEIWQVYCTAKL